MARTKAGKRARGEGSIYFDEANQRWVAAITLDDGRRRKFYRRTQAEALEQLDEARRAKCEGRTANRVPLMGEYLNQYIRTKDVTGAIAPATTVNYTTAARQLRPYIGKVRLDKLTPARVQLAYNELLDHGGKTGGPLSPKSVRICHGLLRGAMRQAVKQRMMTFDPTDAVTAPRPGRYDHKVLTAEQAHRLFEATEGDDFHALWVLMVSTGLRLGEALALKWSALDLNRRTLSVSSTLQRQTGKGIVLKDCKTPASRRAVSLTRTAVDALRAHQDRQQFYARSIGDLWRDHGMVFAGNFGAPLDPHTAWDRFQKALGTAGLDHIRQHDLRHTAATLMLIADVHPKVVQEMLGHANISMTLMTYSHVLPTMQRGAVDRLDEAFNEARIALS